MRIWLLVTSLCVLPPVAMSAQEDGGKAVEDHTKDQDAIRRAIANWDRGWKDFNARLATQDYADDADWTNAFGRARKGRVEVEKYLTDLFQTPQIRSRTSTTSTVDIRFVRPDVAAVTSSRDTVGQRTASGAEYPTRKTHDLRVMANHNGKWVVVSHLIMDEKEVRP